MYIVKFKTMSNSLDNDEQNLPLVQIRRLKRHYREVVADLHTKRMMDSLYHGKVIRNLFSHYNI